jgi:hypothetical protein
VRCGLCGNENADTNYYCGMCGGALVRKNHAPAAAATPVSGNGIAAQRQNSAPAQAPVSTQATRAVSQPTRQSTAVEPPRPARPQADAYAQSSQPEDFVPAITGPSFLGLNVSPPRRNPGSEAAYVDSAGRNSSDHDSRDRATHNDSHRDSLRSSGSVDYLLDDEEEPKRGWGKLLAFVIALALVGGLGYLRWKQGGFDWLLAGKKPAASAEQTGSPESTEGKGTTPDAAGGGASPQPVAPTSTAAPAAMSNDSASAPAASTNGGAAPVANAPSPQTSAQTDAQSTSSTADQPTGEANPSAGSGAQPAPTAATPPSKADDDSDSDATAPAEAPEVSKRLQRKPTPAKPLDSVVEAERYIYGNGVHQDCDRGLRLLKPAARANAKAMISLGTLYSTGTCTPRDLPTAYRWFAMALHKEPDNLPLQNDLQKLWSQMTQPERQLAIKLSQ